MDTGMIKKAALLIRYGLDLKKYNRNADYKALAAEYRSCSDYRELVDAVAVGLGLEVVDANESGIVLAVAGKDTPFAPTSTDIDARCSQADYRQLMGICIAAIAAVAYQRPGALLSEVVQTVTLQDVYDKLILVAEEIIDQGETLDRSGTNRGLFEASQLVLKRSTRATTRAGNAMAGTIRWYLERAFKYLEDQRLVKRDGEQYGGEYKTLSRFRAMLAGRGSIDGVAAVQEALDDAVRRAAAKTTADKAASGSTIVPPDL